MKDSEYSKALQLKRAKLRGVLLDRQYFDRSFGILAAECCYCWKPGYPQEMQVHEVIIARGDVRMSSDRERLFIHDSRNSAWIHPVCHEKAEGGIGRDLAIIHMIRQVGVWSIVDFLMEGSVSGINTTPFARDVWRVYGKALAKQREVYLEAA